VLMTEGTYQDLRYNSPSPRSTRSDSNSPIGRAIKRATRYEGAARGRLFCPNRGQSRFAEMRTIASPRVAVAPSSRPHLSFSQSIRHPCSTRLRKEVATDEDEHLVPGGLVPDDRARITQAALTPGH